MEGNMLDNIIDNLDNKNELEKQINTELDAFKEEVCNITEFPPALVKIIPVTGGLSVVLSHREPIALKDTVISFFKNISPDYTLELGSVVKDTVNSVSNGFMQHSSANLNYYSENTVTFYLTKSEEKEE
ncbi:hypothetical protein MarbSA_14190 [Methanobrevibacter arboriphilus]|uniref:Uncharacterized protein n=1 Tax=Methanobrevibacter arboriphilus TaxID=39441 RepID=A0ACA8R4K5_METAZ|nr:hypothetical protein MarbSA_14190 [Methanobrevibacter arboriphilus]